MHKFTPEMERSEIRTVAKRWDRQYPRGTSASTDRTSAALHALNAEAATAEDVEAIIGNGSWVRLPECEHCGKKTRHAVGFGLGDMECPPSWVCLECLRAAVAMLDA